MSFPESVMTEIVQVWSKAGHSAYGVVTGYSVDEQWYLEPGNKIAVNATGEEVVCNLFGIGAEDTVLEVGSEIVWDERRYRAVDVQKMRPGGVTHHVEAYFLSVAES